MDPLYHNISCPYLAEHRLMLQVPWASLGRAPVLVELDRLYLLAGPKEEFEEQDSYLEQVYTVMQLTMQLACH